MKIFIILPTQLFLKNDYLKNMDKIYIIEESFYFTSKKFHKQKLILHRASMKYYYDKLKNKYKNVFYYEFNNLNYIINIDDEIFMFDPIDKPMINLFNKYNLTLYDSPSFLETIKDLTTYRNEFTNKKKYYHDISFYRWQRRRLNLLINNNKPINNTWTFDKENRNPFDKNYKENKIITYNNKYIQEAKLYIIKHFNDNFGLIDDFYYPITHKETYKHFKNFIKSCFNFSDIVSIICSSE
jgi:deoxyribodipyrimidine photolyase-related protein